MPHSSAPRPHSAGSPAGHHHHHHHPGRSVPVAEPPPPPRHSQPQWEASEEMRLQELEEAKARASQMEKTMRWWSDCTANWREKWSKVRAERNKAREELRAVRLRLETSLKETAAVRRDRQEIEAENEALSADLEHLRRLLVQRCQCGGPVSALAELRLNSAPGRTATEDRRGARPKQARLPVEVVLPSAKIAAVSAISTVSPMSAVSPVSVSAPGTQRACAEFVESSADDVYSSSPRLPVLSVPACLPLSELSPLEKEAPSNGEPTSPRKEETDKPEKRLSRAASEVDLSQAKSVQAEREEKAALQRSVETLRRDLSEMRARLDDVRLSRQETLKQLMELRAQHENQLTSIQLDLRDETSSRQSRDQQLAELRAELERLQAENAAEWQRRERVDTEKVAVERENKQLRAHVTDLEERLEQRSRQLSQAAETENKQLQTEVFEKTRELSELRHAHSKLKKVLQEKATELSHGLRRAEQFEAEVRRLRGRVDELKRELGSAEDEVDSTASSQRRLLRTNEELQHQLDTLTVQLRHLQARARSSTSTVPSIKDKILVDGETDDEELGEL